MASTEELAYLAGVIDGEGYIGVEQTSNLGFCLSLKIYNTNKNLIDWINERFDFRLVKFIREGPDKKDIYVLRLSGYEAQDLLERVKSYIVGKKNQVELALQFPARRNKSTAALSEEVLLKQALCFIELRKLNKRGKRDGIDIDSE